MSIDLSCIKNTLPAIRKLLIENYGSINNGYYYLFENYKPLLCTCCEEVLENQGFLQFDENKKVYLKLPYHRACLKSECYSSKIKVASIEYKVKVLGKNEDELRLEYSYRIKKTVQTKKDNGYYDDKSNNPYSKEFWIKSGLSEEEALAKIKNKAKAMVETKRKSGFYDDKSNNPYSKDYWVKRGLSEREAQLKINSKNHNCFDYWIKRGYQNEDAKILASISAGTNSLREIEKRHGKEKALQIYKDRGDKISKSWTILSTRHQKFGTSKAANNFFEELSYKLNILGLASTIIFKNNNCNQEWFIRGYYKIYFYDCYIKEANLLIEFNGEHVHPRKDRMSIEQWNAWRHAFSKKTAFEIEEQDNEKMRTALQNGYKLMYVWSKDVKIDKDLQINNIINLIRNENEYQNTK